MTDLMRSVRCCRTTFIAFADEYHKAVLSGRQKLWADAVRATVQMLEDHPTPYECECPGDCQFPNGSISICKLLPENKPMETFEEAIERVRARDVHSTELRK